MREYFLLFSVSIILINIINLSFYKLGGYQLSDRPVVETLKTLNQHFDFLISKE